MKNLQKIKNTRFITEAAVIAAIYAALTILLAPISYNLFQVRVSEALTVLPAFTPTAIPGLFIGCLIANIYGGRLIDIVFGSLATLAAAYLSYKMPKKWLVPLPPVVINAVVIGYIYRAADMPLIASMGLIGLEQAVACYGLGYPLMLVLAKVKDKIFKTW